MKIRAITPPVTQYELDLTPTEMDALHDVIKGYLDDIDGNTFIGEPAQPYDLLDQMYYEIHAEMMK